MECQKLMDFELYATYELYVWLHAFLNLKCVRDACIIKRNEGFLILVYSRVRILENRKNGKKMSKKKTFGEKKGEETGFC